MRLSEDIESIIEDLMEKSSEAYDNEDLEKSFDYLVSAYNEIPESKKEYSDSYNHCSYILDFVLEENYRLDQAMKWLDTLKEIAEYQKNWEGSFDFFSGKTHFRLGDFEKAKKDFDECVKIGRGMRYFEDEDPKYKDFYLNPEKFLNK